MPFLVYDYCHHGATADEIGYPYLAGRGWVQPEGGWATLEEANAYLQKWMGCWAPSKSVTVDEKVTSPSGDGDEFIVIREVE